MPATLLTPPAAEPLSLIDAKAFLRVEHGDDDALIAALIAAARGHVEAFARCALVAQTWRLTLDRWPESGRIRPRIGPLQALAAARLRDDGGGETALEVGSFVVDRATGEIAAPPWALPPPPRAAAGIELDLDVCFGAAADVPPMLAQALRMLVAHWYENRGLIAIGQSVAMMPASINAMIAAYRVPAL